MLLRKNCLYIYTDGSSFQKPRKGGMGIRYVYLDDIENEHSLDINIAGYYGATNNQMELKAVIESLRELKHQNIPIYYNSIEVRTDSRYVVDNKIRAIYNWSKQKWLNQYGKPIENALLWKELIKILRSINCRVEIVWVKGHSKDLNNKVVDRLAKQSAKSLLKPPINVIKLRRKKSDKSTKLGSVGMKGQRVSIHIINEEYLRLQNISKYRYEIISKRSPYYGNVDIVYSEIHYLKAGHKYFVIFNKDENNPRILKMIKEIDLKKT
jgi:ribonuclease HI